MEAGLQYPEPFEYGESEMWAVNSVCTQAAASLPPTARLLMITNTLRYVATVKAVQYAYEFVFDTLGLHWDPRLLASHGAAVLSRLAGAGIAITAYDTMTHFRIHGWPDNMCLYAGKFIQVCSLFSRSFLVNLTEIWTKRSKLP